MDDRLGESRQTPAARVTAGLRVHAHDRQPRRRGAGGDCRLPFSVAGTGALAADARDGAQHRARDARPPGRTVRARAGDRGLERQARARCRRARCGLSVRQHARTGAAGGGRLPLSAHRNAGGPARAWRLPAGRNPTATTTRPIATSSSWSIVEEVSALEHVDDIAATPGVDVLFVGTGDLSFSLGSARAAAAPAGRRGGLQRARRRAPSRQDRRTSRRNGRRDATLHRAGLSLLSGAIRAGAVRERSAAVSRAARHHTGASPARAVLTTAAKAHGDLPHLNHQSKPSLNRRSEGQEVFFWYRSG